MQERCRRREHILRSSALRQAKGPTIQEGDHVDVADAIYCHCLLQIILRLRVRIGRGALLKIVLASKLPDLCIELSRRKPQNEYHYQSESNESCVLQLRYYSSTLRIGNSEDLDHQKFGGLFLFSSVGGIAMVSVAQNHSGPL